MRVYVYIWYARCTNRRKKTERRDLETSRVCFLYLRSGASMCTRFEHMLESHRTRTRLYLRVEQETLWMDWCHGSPLAFMIPGLRYGPEHTVPWLNRRETTLDLLSLWHQRRRLHYEGGDDGHCDCRVRADGKIRWSELGPRGCTRKGGSHVPGKEANLWITVWEKHVGNIRWGERDQSNDKFRSSVQRYELPDLRSVDQLGFVVRDKHNRIESALRILELQHKALNEWVFRVTFVDNSF